MRIAFRTDASILIGTGHVMRCLTLADALRERGAQCAFVCREHRGNLLELIEQRGHEVTALPAGPGSNQPSPAPGHAAWLGTDWSTDAEQTRQALNQNSVDWLVVDHYALDRTWEQAMRPHCRQIMAIDDLADRPHDCDLLLDQNLGRTSQDYVALIASEAQALLGPQYALLRPEFAQWREYSLARRHEPRLRKLLITMGGVDRSNATGAVLNVLKLCELPDDVRINVVMGRHAPWLPQVQAEAESMPWPTAVLAGASNMAQLMADSDLALGSAGSTAWERCAVGLPSLVVVLADNQRPGAMALQRAGAAVVAKDNAAMRDLLLSMLARARDAMVLAKMSESAAALVDGVGALRVVDKVLSSHV